MTGALVAVVVVPARDEEHRIDDCLQALGAQVGMAPGSYEVVVVLHRCCDGTAAAVEGLRGTPGMPPLRIITCATGGVGLARRVGMDAAHDLLVAAGRPRGLIATTDADSAVAPDWLCTQLALLGSGAEAIGGLIELHPAEAAALPPGVLRERTARAEARMAAVRRGPSGTAAEHHFFSGASIGLDAATYRRVGGMPAVEALEDEALGRALTSSGVAITYSAAVRVRTSARRDGRAPRGLAIDLAVSSWRASRSYEVGAFGGIDALAEGRTARVSVVIPARREAATIGAVVATALTLRDVGLVDEVIVVDAASPDGTAEVAAAAGAEVFQQDELLAEWGPCLGKGDAMWRAQSVATGDVLCFVDADTVNFTPDFAAATLAPLLVYPHLMLSKGRFERPLRIGEVAVPHEGGRVTELAARPILNLWYPALAGFDQPLAGEVAIRRDVMAQLAVPVGYGVEIAMLIDTWRRYGLDALCQVDLGVRQNRHQPLRELSAMAYAVLVAAASRCDVASAPAGAGPLLLPPLASGDTAEVRQVPVVERPPYATVAGR